MHVRTVVRTVVSFQCYFSSMFVVGEKNDDSCNYVLFLVIIIGVAALNFLNKLDLGEYAPPVGPFIHKGKL